MVAYRHKGIGLDLSVSSRGTAPQGEPPNDRKQARGVSVGYELRRKLADTLPEGLSSGERLVVLELADQANDRTRLAYGKNLLALVARRCGFSSEKQVGKILGKLAKRGIELRVQVVRDDGTPLIDKLGRPVFAYDGHETTYQIPLLEPPGPPGRSPAPDPEVPPAGDHLSTDRPPEVSHPGDLSLLVVSQQGDHLSTGGPPPGRPQDGSGPPPGAQWSPARGQVVPPAGDPSPHLSSGTPQSVDAGARQREAHRWLKTNYGLTDDESTQVIEKVRARGPRRINNLVRYMAPMITEGTLADIVAAVQLQADRTQQDEPQDEFDEPPPPRLTLAPYERSARDAIAAATPPAGQQLPLLLAVDGGAPTSADREVLLEETARHLAKARRRPPIDRAQLERAMDRLRVLPVPTYLALCKQARAELGADATTDEITLRAAVLSHGQRDERKHG